MAEFPTAVHPPSNYNPPNMGQWLSSFLSNTIGDLPNDYYNGVFNRQNKQLNQQKITQGQQEIDQTNTFQGGIPTTGGQPDYRKMVEMLYQKGAFGPAAQLSPMVQQQGAGTMSPLLSDEPASSHGSGPYSARSTTAPPASAGLAQPTGFNDNAKRITQGGDGEGPTVRQFVSARMGNSAQAGELESQLAMKLDVDPNAPMTQGQQRRALGLLNRYAGGAPDSAAPTTAAAPAPNARPTAPQFTQPNQPVPPNPGSPAAQVAQGFGALPPQNQPLQAQPQLRAPMQPQQAQANPSGLPPATAQVLQPPPAAQPAQAQPVAAQGGVAGGQRPGAGPPAATGPIGPQVPLPKGFGPGQEEQAILALRREAARVSSNPYAEGQAKALNQWADGIEKSITPQPYSSLQNYIIPRTGQNVSPAGPTGESEATLDADAARYRLTGTLPPNMGRGIQGQQLAAQIRQRAVEQEVADGGNPEEDWAPRWARFKTQKGYTGQVDDIAAGIKDGTQPPTLTGLYGLSGPIRQKLEQDGFNLAKAQLEYARAQRQIASLNGPQMTRFVGLAGSVVNTIDEVRNLADQMQLGNFPIKNRAEIEAYIQTMGNTPNGQLAARYIGAINTLKEEFANLAQGGYAPTEAVWALANKQIDQNYGVKEIGASLDEIQRLINYRIQGIPNINTMGANAPNRYFPQAPQPQPPSAAPAPDKDGWTTLSNGNQIREVQ